MTQSQQGTSLYSPWNTSGGGEKKAVKVLHELPSYCLHQAPVDPKGR